MSTPRDIATPLTRITWRDGQTLASGDLRDDQIYTDRLRHLHIRYQHRTWGVVEGLAVGFAGSAAVLVRPGYALDIEGRELLVPVFTRVPTPNIVASTTMYLVISWNTAAAGCAPTPDLATLCPGVRNPLPVEQGQLSWKTVTEVRVGTDVLLARVLIAAGRLASPIDMSVQRFAATMNQPLFWSGSTMAGQTGWVDETNTLLPEIRTDVDTSDGGFVSTHAYFVRLVGASEIAAGFVTNVAATKFRIVVRPHAAHAVGGATVTAAAAESAGWTVAWLAVELKG
jgi:hypothetical protein